MLLIINIILTHDIPRNIHEKIAKKTSNILDFWFILRFSSYVENCKNNFLWMAFSISSDLPWSFLNIRNLTEKFEKNTFSCKVFWELCQKNVRYHFETLPIATPFNQALMCFLIEKMCFGDQFRQKMQLNLQKRLLDTRVSRCSAFLNKFTQGIHSKKRKFRLFENSVFSAFLGYSEEIFSRKK